MRRFLEVVLLTAGLGVNLAVAQNDAPKPISPEKQQWISPPAVPGLRATWMLGSEKGAGLYLLRVKLARGTHVPLHTHPDERNTTVLSGTLYVGFGESFAEDKMVAVQAGSVYVAPANVPHYLWARDGEVVYQESGVGPTATNIFKP